MSIQKPIKQLIENIKPYIMSAFYLQMINLCW